MYKRLASALLLVGYGAVLIKVMVLKDMPMVRIGHIMLNFGGEAYGQGNFVPFKTIVPYLLGYKGLVIAGVNLIGNIVLLVPLGFLVPLVYPNITWKKSLALAVASCLTIEVLQVLLRVGIFDIDDVILNVLGFMLGYWACLALVKVLASKYKLVAVAALVAILAAALYVVAINPKVRLSADPRAGVGAGMSERSGGDAGSTQSGGLCGDTSGNGQIVSVGDSSFVMKRNDGGDQIINLISQAEINTPSGPGSISDLRVGNNVTLVGGPNPDGSFTAEAVFVCGVPNPEE